MALIADSAADRPETARVITRHRDAVTGVDAVYAGMTRAGIYRGVYDSSVPGRISWAAVPELAPTSERVMSAVTAHGVLYATVDSNGNPRDQDGGLFRRVDGPAPRWELVYEWPADPRKGNGLRGLTAVPDPGGSPRQVLIGTLESSGTGLGGGATLAAYNDMAPAVEPGTGNRCC